VHPELCKRFAFLQTELGVGKCLTPLVLIPRVVFRAVEFFFLPFPFEPFAPQAHAYA